MKNRVVGLEYIKASEILPNPKNFQTHPESQKRLFAAVAEDVGMAGALIVYRTDQGYMLIDGHMRQDMAGDEIVPVLVTDLDETEADKILATFDPIKRMAIEDEDKKQALYEVIAARESSKSDFLQAIEKAAEPAISFEDWLGLIEGETEELPRNDDFVFASDNEWGIPVLDAGLQADALVLPALLWNTGRQSLKTPGGTLLFYCDDFRFEALFNDPTAAVTSKAAYLVEPNYSVYADTPRAIAMYATYRKRWVARYCQHYGMRVWVDLYTSQDEINLIGVPRGWRSYATRGNVNTGNIEKTWELACDHRGSDDVLFLVYGGGTTAELFCREKGWLWLPEYMDMRRKWKKEIGNG